MIVLLFIITFGIFYLLRKKPSYPKQKFRFPNRNPNLSEMEIPKFEEVNYGLKLDDSTEFIESKEPDLNLISPSDEKELDFLKVKNDKQNTHNSGIVASIMSSIKKLKDTTVLKMDIPESLKQIRDYITTETERKQEIKSNALKTLDKMEIADADIKGNSELNVLNTVWNKISGYNQQDSYNAKYNLMNNMSEAVENEKVVCATGRLERVVDSLNLIDEDVIIKPDWIFKREILDSAGVIRSGLYSELSPEEKNVVNTLTPNYTDSLFQSSFDSRFKDTLYQKVDVDYISKDLMTKVKADNYISEIMGSL